MFYFSLTLIILIGLSAFFSASETAFFSLGAIRLEKFKKRERRALRIEHLKKDSGFLLSSILVGNMLVNIAISSILEQYFEKRFGSGFLFVSVLISSVFILFLGEIIPKTFAFYNAEKFSLFSFPFLKVFISIFSPLSHFANFISRIGFRIFFRGKSNSCDFMNEEEFKVVLSSLKDNGLIKPKEEEMVKSVLEFSETEAAEIMTPRVQLKMVDIDENRELVKGLVRNSKHSFLPVYKDSVDNIIGVISTKDFFLYPDKAIKDIASSPFFVPETIKINNLAKELRQRKIKLAVVIDEYGGLSGIVTLEDIVEEIFGEIYDEFELQEEKVRQMSDKEFLVSARVSISEINHILELGINEDENTLAGFILGVIGRFPHRGENIDFDNFSITIEKSTARRILLVRVRVK